MFRAAEIPSALCEIALAAPADQVWAAWTDPREIARWHAESARGQATPGDRLQLGWESLGLTLDLEVIAAEPPRRLLLRAHPPGQAPQDLEIHIERRERTHLRLEHRGFVTADEAEGSLSGWRSALALLGHYLDRYRGRDRHCAATLTPVVGSFDELSAHFTDPGCLARWLGSTTSALGEPGAPVALRLIPRGDLRGRVLARSAREITFSISDLDGAAALRCFSLDGKPNGAKMVGAQLSSWAADDARLQVWRGSFEEAVARLGRLFGTSTGARA